MANTFKKIQTVTVGAGGAATIDFTSIPQTYTDLKLVYSIRTSYAGIVEQLNLSLNTLTTNFSGQYLQGSGSSSAAGSLGRYAGNAVGANATASVFGNTELYIPNYTSANNKSFSIDFVTENNAIAADAGLIAGLWSNTAAITGVTLTPASGGTIQQYSSATLYGVSNVTAAQNAYATGGIITYDDTYVYHTFPWSGTFTPTRSLNVDYLVVAGGGGTNSCDQSPGGGGAGGLRCTVGATGGGGSLESQLAVTATAYTVTVGAGGAKATNNTTGANGSNSVFSSITSTGGGGGGNAQNSGSAASMAGATGGSGGGGGGNNVTQTSNGGTGTTNQGYAGGTGNGSASVSTNRASGGGGGAGAVGANATTGGTPGNGGNGVTTSISGTSTTYGGGGGGSNAFAGTFGSPGSGGGGGTGVGYNAIVNTGGGAAGGGGNGGSGIVIVRYAR